MLSEEQIELLGDKYLVGLYQELEREVLQDIARRVRKTERLTETAEIMAKSMRENGYSAAEIHAEVMKKLNATPEYRRMIAENTYAYKQEVKQKIAETVKTAKEAGDKLIGEAGEMAFNEDLSMWEQGGVDLKQPNSMKQITDGFKAQAKNDLKNISGTTAFKTPLLGTVKTAEAYQRSLDLALLKVSTGTYSYKQACDDMIKEFTRSGLRTVDYASGRTYQVDTAVRMIVRTSTAQLAGKITEANCRTTGQDLVIISQHMGSRDTHVYFQNKVFSMSGKSKKYPDIHAPLGEGCAYGRPEGLQGPNCTHMFYPFWEGISEIPEPLKEPDPVEYKGRTYTRYEATQQMRAMEREIRALKREKYVADENVDRNQIAAQIRANKDEYMRFSEAMNLKPKENRLLVGGERSKWQNMLNELSQHKKGKNVLINDVAIQKVKHVRPNYMTDEQAEMLAQAHRELLKFSMLHNNSNEVAQIISVNKAIQTSYMAGDMESINVEANTDMYHLLRTSEPQSLELLHNHPGLSYFSLPDIRFFLKYDSIKTMTIVTNKGNVWYINKTEKYDRKSVYALLRKLANSETKIDYDELVEKFLKQSYNLGIERN